MLSLEQITNFYPPGLHSFARHLLTEYLQCEVLDSIFRQKAAAQLSFMGGTAIRIIYAGDRFSQDLDFDNFGLSFTQFATLLEATKKDLENKGFELEIKLVEKGAYHCYFKFPELLIKNKLTTDPRAKILVRIDSVKKTPMAPPIVQTLTHFNLYQTILVNSKSTILAQKIHAVFNRTKGRDLYDLTFLWSQTTPDWQLLTNLIGVSDPAELKKKLTAHIQTLDLPRLARDVEPFLIEPNKINRVLDLPALLQKQLTQEISRSR